MKIRNGFVSNSSSSSFIYILKNNSVNLNDINWKEVISSCGNFFQHKDDSTLISGDGFEKIVSKYDQEELEKLSPSDIINLMINTEEKSIKCYDRKKEKLDIKEIKEMCENKLKTESEIYQEEWDCGNSLFEVFSEFIIPHLIKKEELIEVARINQSSSGMGSLHFVSLESINKKFGK